MTNANARSAANSLRAQLAPQQTEEQEFAQFIAQEFNDMLYEFHKHPQPYDELMDAELHEQYARILREQAEPGYFSWKKAPDGTPRPAFSPSGASKSERELYEKARKAMRDPQAPTPNQRNWTALGSQVGDYIQREVLLAERHYEILTGLKPKFRFERTDRGEPKFEHFVKVMHEVEHNGEKFALNGLPDGILIYTADDGREYRVGLEVKSFQKSYSEFKKQDKPKSSHVDQTICYSEMYDLDYYIVLYHLTYGVKWDQELNRNKTFGLVITQEDREKIFDKFANVAKAVRLSHAPSLDLFEWDYYEYKRSTALSLTDEELADLYSLKSRMLRSRLPDWKKQRLVDALEFIEKVRKGEAV